MKKIVVNFASGTWYPRGQKRLQDSLKKYDDCEFVGFQSHNEIPCPSHKETPYAFKTFSLMKMKEYGADMAIFADASIYAVKSWKPIWDIVAEQGYYLEEAGHWTGTWTKDSVLDKYGLTRDEAMKIPMHSAGFTALNFHNKTAVEFLEKWHEAAQDGFSFKGNWTNKNQTESSDPRCKGHRHDMSVASILAHQLGMKHGSGGQYLAYIGAVFGEPKETVCAYLRPTA